MKKKILFFDDDERRARRWAEELERLPIVNRDFDVQHMTIGDFKLAKEDLNGRRKKAREKEGGRATDWSHSLDQVAILIVDFDLLQFDADVTAESIAYLARCYSRCGLVVALNQFNRRAHFDLTLKGHPESFADLNLHDSQIHNYGLWKEPWKGFRPWSWPLLPRAVEAFERRVEEVLPALDKPILPFLGFDRISPFLPRSTVEFIASKGQKPEQTTFRQFVEESQQGLQARDKALDDESIARVAAARIYKWLDRLVLSGQDILVDVPHLVSRFPSLLGGNPKTQKAWNNVLTLGKPPKKSMHTDLIDKFRFKKENWVSRPCWFWGELSSYEEIPEVKDPWQTVKRGDLVFCEDVSRFLPRTEAKEFVADLPTPFVRRYVHAERGIDYQPNVRFAL
jgi:hypothetical protein